MIPTEYQELAARTESPWQEAFERIYADRDRGTVIRLLHAMTGIQTESGEFSDTIKRWLFYGKELDVVNLEVEIGDLMWYIALACNALGVSLSSIMVDNINKLRVRYPSKFDQHSALNRDLEAERNVFESVKEINIVTDRLWDKVVKPTSDQLPPPSREDKEKYLMNRGWREVLDDLDEFGHPRWLYNNALRESKWPRAVRDYFQHVNHFTLEQAVRVQKDVDNLTGQ